MRLLPVLIALPLLAACHAKADKTADTVTVDTGKGVTAHASSGPGGLSIDTDDFKASLEIPGMTINGKAFDIDGMTLLPASKVRGMSVQDHGKDDQKNSKVTIRFTSPDAPAAVLDHAESQAKAKGWTVARTAAGLGGTRGGKTMAYAVVANGTATDGTVVITGSDRDD